MPPTRTPRRLVSPSELRRASSPRRPRATWPGASLTASRERWAPRSSKVVELPRRAPNVVVPSTALISDVVTTGATHVYDQGSLKTRLLTDPIAPREARHAPLYLHIVRGAMADTMVPIPQGDLRLGRSRSAGLRLAHHSVSRKHAVLVRRGDHLWIGDLGSQNGTYLNGNRVRGTEVLEIGDTVHVGNTKMVVRGQSLVMRLDGGASFVDHPIARAGVMALALLAGLLIVVVARSGGAAAEPPLPPVVAARDPFTPTSPVRAISRDEQGGWGVATSRAAAVPSPGPSPSLVPRSGEGGENGYAALASSPIHHASRRPDPLPAQTRRARKARRGAPADRAILGAYLAGEVDRALALARRAQSPLAERVEEFRTTFESAKRHLAARNYDAALDGYRRALEADTWLARKSPYQRELRRRISSLHTIDGLRAVEAGDTDRAVRAFERALAQDRSNDRARRMLASLRDTHRDAAPEPAVDDEVQSRRSQADAAFDE